MLPTRPRSSVRSTWSSWTAPFSTMPTRVSCGDQLMRMSCMKDGLSGGFSCGASGEAYACLLKQFGRLVQRQTHDSGVAALDARDPGGRGALDRIGAGLAERLAAGHVRGDAFGVHRGHVHLGDADGHGLELTVPDGHGGDHPVGAARE